MEETSVIGLISTLRGRISSELLHLFLNRSNSYDDILEVIYKLGGDKRISNSESLLLASMYGAKQNGARVNLVHLSNYCSLDGGNHYRKDDLLTIVEESQGIIISTPVYFGDRSSLIQELFDLLNSKRSSSPFPLNNKAVGVVSVGAKRNGGQETAITYALAECLNMGAAIVGNGPPTAQYGGTGVGGNVGTIIDDSFGLMTSKGTGQRVAVLADLLNQKDGKGRADILFIVTRKDSEGEFLDSVHP
jgi:multimeric flavodoxin WrbA